MNYANQARNDTIGRSFEKEKLIVLDAKDKVRYETSQVNDAPGKDDVKNVTDTVSLHPDDLQNASDRQASLHRPPNSTLSNKLPKVVAQLRGEMGNHLS